MPKIGVLKKSRRILYGPIERNRDSSSRPFHPTTSFKIYRREIQGSAYQPLSRQELDNHVSELLKGNEEARDIIINHCLKFAADIAYKYAGRHVPVSDLIQLANLGLITGVDCAFAKFNPQLGGFFTYLASYIHQPILNALQEERTIVSSSPSADTVRVRSAIDFLYNLLQREPTVAEVAEQAELSIKAVEREYKKINNTHIIYLYAKSNHATSDDRSLIDTMPSKNSSAPDELIQVKEDLVHYRSLVVNIAGYLQPRLKRKKFEVFCYRYGLDGSGLPKSVIDITATHKVSRQGVDFALKSIWREKYIANNMNEKWFVAVLEHIVYLHEQLGEIAPPFNFLVGTGIKE